MTGETDNRVDADPVILNYILATQCCILHSTAFPLLSENTKMERRLFLRHVVKISSRCEDMKHTQT
jgi:hypothetical protein